jgi:Kef-type K+ transport system membrane component KefB
MNHHDLIQFFLQIGLMLAVALVCGQLMRRIHQPAVLGELLGGIFLGPTVLGWLAPTLSAQLFPAEGLVALSLDAVLKLGMLFFLFVAGLEVKLGDLRQQGFRVTLTSLFGVLVPFGLGFGTVYLWPAWWGSTQANTFLLALFIGAALSISALPVIARILIDLKLIQSETGIVIMAAATINDLIGWSLFAIILSSLAPGSSSPNLGLILISVASFVLFIFVFGHQLGQPLLQRLRTSVDWPGGFIGLITIFILIAAALAEAIGLHAIFGAFLIGVALGQKDNGDNPVHEIIYQFAISFFAPLYFVSIGLKANFLTYFDGWLVLIVLLIASLGKIGGAGLGAWLAGIPTRRALAIGFGLNARGAMEIILASVALEYQLIDQKLFVALVVMALVTSMLSGPAMQRLIRPKSYPARLGESAKGLKL